MIVYLTSVLHFFATVLDFSLFPFASFFSCGGGGVCFLCPCSFTEGIDKSFHLQIIMEYCSCMKVKRNSGKANYTAKNAPPFCEIWFIYKGRHIWTREASETPCSLSSCAQPEIAATESLRCRSFQYGENELFHSEYLEPNSSRTAVCSGIRSLAQGEIIETEATNSSKSSSCSSHCSPKNSAGVYLDTCSEVMEERVNSQLMETKREAEAATDEAFAKLLKCKRLEVEAMEAIRRVSHKHNLVIVHHIGLLLAKKLLVFAFVFLVSHETPSILS